MTKAYQIDAYTVLIETNFGVYKIQDGLARKTELLTAGVPEITFTESDLQSWLDNAKTEQAGNPVCTVNEIELLQVIVQNKLEEFQ